MNIFIQPAHKRAFIGSDMSRDAGQGIQAANAGFLHTLVANAIEQAQEAAVFIFQDIKGFGFLSLEKIIQEHYPTTPHTNAYILPYVQPSNPHHESPHSDASHAGCPSG